MMPLARFNNVPIHTEEIRLLNIVHDAILTTLERAMFFDGKSHHDIIENSDLSIL
jgi:hypothetical protein